MSVCLYVFLSVYNIIYIPPNCRVVYIFTLRIHRPPLPPHQVEDVHQRTPLYLGSVTEVSALEKYMQFYEGKK